MEGGCLCFAELYLYFKYEHSLFILQADRTCSACFYSGKEKTLGKESQFQSALIKKIKSMFPGCIILKNDPNYIQGFPDLTILWGRHWALLECKRESEARKQPNQPYYVDKGNSMSFARFICPENEEEVLHDLQQAFGA